MEETGNVRIAIVGSGPGGLSAAAHAAEIGVSHVLLEATDTFANTIQRYQKGKLVMAEPGYLPLRSPLPFEIGSREEVLGRWAEAIETGQLRIRYGAEVKSISGEQGAFHLETTDGHQLDAEAVILAIGVQGNPRKVPAPGGDLPCVQYTLDDPDAYRDETIVVIGAGDSALENALALAAHNQVCIVNRRDEFARAKPANLEKILAAIADGRINCYYQSNAASIEAQAGAAKPYLLTLKTADGQAEVPCDRIIARLGAIPPRKFVESCGIGFPSTDPAALPTLDAHYQSTVPGLYVIGALGGYPLIKQAMNQGYEVVEYILGKEIQPADHPLLAAKLALLPYELDVDQCLHLLQRRIPMFTQINPLMFRELVLESQVLTPKGGEVIYREGDYSTGFFTVLDGVVEIGLGGGSRISHRVRQGEFFGELSLISGRRRSNTAVAAEDCLLIETPRRVINKLRTGIDSVRRGIDVLFIARVLQEVLVPELGTDGLRDIAAKLELRSHAKGDTVFEEEQTGESLQLVRQGSLTLTRETTEGVRTVGYVPSMDYCGEISLMGVGRYTESARAEVATETIAVGREQLLALIGRDKTVVDRVQRHLRKRLSAYVEMETDPRRGAMLRFLMEHGLGEATDALIIDERLCVGCDNCEKACADTHLGIARLRRDLGPTFAAIHLPISCRHCEQPHCMKDCPPDAIHRTQAGEVYIDAQTCIGCGNCVQNCPYGVIRMEKPRQRRPLLQALGGWLGTGKQRGTAAAPQTKKAYKCDLCKDLKGGAACVRACPTGAALRVQPGAFTRLIS